MKYVVEVTTTTVSRHEVDIVMPLGATGPEVEKIGDTLMRKAARSGQQLISEKDRVLGEPVATVKVTKVTRGPLVVYPRRENKPKAPVKVPEDPKKP